jgi:glutamate synthase (NADPH/NADH) small chain
MTDTCYREIDRKQRVHDLPVDYMELGEPDSSGRRRPIPKEGSETIEEIDTVILAVGYWPDPLMGKTTPNLATRKWGLIVADEAVGATTHDGVFAAGDAVHGPDLVVTAIATAHRAATSIDRFLRGESIPQPVVK